MNKLHTYFKYFMFVCTLAFLSCEKLEIPNIGQTNAVEKESNTTDGNDKTDASEEATDEAYSVSDIINRKFTEIEEVYVVGYIVGYVKTSNMDFCRFSRGDVETNILIADTPVDTFSTKCIPVQLSTATIQCKATRTALNLADNDVLGQKVRLQGEIDKYMGTYGLLKARNHTFLENDFDGNEYEKEDEDDENDGNKDENAPNPTPDTPEERDDEQENDSITNQEQWENLIEYIYTHGTADAPFTITDFKSTLPKYLSHYGATEIGHPGMKDVYICGYIVGYVPQGKHKIESAIFSNEGASPTNIILADSPEEHDWNNCIAVELSTSSNRHKEVRAALNLSDHPENYKKRFIIYGNITDYHGYMGAIGMKSTREYMSCDEE